MGTSLPVFVTDRLSKGESLVAEVTASRPGWRAWVVVEPVMRGARRLWAPRVNPQAHAAKPAAFMRGAVDGHSGQSPASIASLIASSMGR